MLSSTVKSSCLGHSPHVKNNQKCKTSKYAGMQTSHMYSSAAIKHVLKLFCFVFFPKLDYYELCRILKLFLSIQSLLDVRYCRNEMVVDTEISALHTSLFSWHNIRYNICSLILERFTDVTSVHTDSSLHVPKHTINACRSVYLLIYIAFYKASSSWQCCLIL